MNAVAHHHFALTGRKPAAFDKLDAAAELQAVLHHATHGNIDFTGAVGTGKHDHDHSFSRN